MKTSLTVSEKMIKRTFDIVFAAIGLMITWWIILIACIIARIDTRQSGFFKQTRIGMAGRKFNVIKIRSMRKVEGVNTVVTTDHDPRITSWGRFFRKTKIDELPQLYNVLVGDMSFVGPRPDVEGFADKLEGEDRIILNIRPGITGPATLKYRNEEKLMAEVDDPETFNREVIWPDKVAINKSYIQNYSLFDDLKYIMKTIFR